MVFELLQVANRLLLRHGLGEHFTSQDCGVILLVAVKLQEFADRLVILIEERIANERGENQPPAG